MTTLDLAGQWQLQQAGHREVLPATVPGCVHTDLLAAKKIPDPFYRDNEERLQWIGETDWIYSREFAVPADLLRHRHVLLRCEGLDTLATITINGNPAGKADNMYRTWEFDVRRCLKPGRNTIVVRFASAMKYIRARQAQRALPSWGGPREPKGRPWLRKEPCNFGWDWGPVLVTCGIWRPIQLVARDTARQANIQILQHHAKSGAVSLTVNAAARVTLNGEEVAASTAPATLRIPHPQLWWPNGLGKQPLYTVTVNGQSRRIGLRTLRLDRHKDQWGESFQFVVNGQPFFAKGANWIPADAFATRVTPARYRHLLQSAADANMNMLRVWGGGIYEDDLFYDLCDELGLCVWQDFMFACSTYPTFDKPFMKNVEAEFRDNIRRLRHHPCLALWCGNNELEQGLVGPKWTERQMRWKDYSRLFDKLLPRVVAELDPERDYWPASPHTPPPGDRVNYNDPTRGDAHLWDVWHGRKPFEWYRTCTHRFNSEFGFQSFPEPHTVRAFTAPADRNVSTYVMEHHQRSGIGNDAILQYMLAWYRLPHSFDMTLWLSQIQHGLAMKYAVEHWRRSRPRGMGTLYWQINDCWPAASWASIDCHGRWKALHYMARDFFAPVLLSGLEDREKRTVELHITNDTFQSVTGIIHWQLTDLTGRTITAGQLAARAKPQANTRVATLNLKKHLDPRDALLWLDLPSAGTRNLVLFARPKHLELPAPGIRIAVRAAGKGQFAVRVSAKRPALWTWLELKSCPAHFSNNFFHLHPRHPVDVLVTPEKPLTLAKFRAKLMVSSLTDTYTPLA